MYYNIGRKIMKQPEAKSVREVSFSWMQQQAKKLAPAISSPVDAGVCDLTGLDKKQVLRALFNSATHQGMGVLGSSHPSSSKLTDNEADKALESKDIDYLKGRSMKLYFSGDRLDVSLYNRENGHNAAQNALKALVQTKAAPVKSDEK